MVITRFEDIEGWKLGRELTRRIYQVAGRGLFAKDYGLRDQIQRAAGSVMHNIAEGFDGGSNAEFAKFLRYASGRAVKCKANFMSPWIRPTCRRMNSTNSTPWRNMRMTRSAASSSIWFKQKRTGRIPNKRQKW